jgi:hypothetical protein
MLRADPWNEFVQHPVSAADILDFASLRESEMSRLNQRVKDHLTVVMGDVKHTEEPDPSDKPLANDGPTIPIL